MHLSEQWAGNGFGIQIDLFWNPLSATYKLNDFGQFNKYINNTRVSYDLGSISYPNLYLLYV